MVSSTQSQAEGGGQRDPLMLSSPSDNTLLQALQSQLRGDERLFVFIDVVFAGSCQCNPWDSAERVVPPFIHPRPPRENPSLEQGRAATWHRRDAGSMIPKPLW